MNSTRYQPLQALCLALGLSLLSVPIGSSASQVIAWGAGATNSGQYPDLGQSIVPADLTNAMVVAGGETFSLALRSDRTVAAWGDDSAGQTDVPSGLTGVVSIAAGYAHALALKADGTVVAWGANDFHQTDVPADLTNAVSIAAGQYHSVALRSNGKVTAWGDNTLHQTQAPVSLSNFVAIAAGRLHCLALRSDGTVIAWGDNSSGQSTPPPGLSSIVGIAAADTYSLALKGNGTLVAWGSENKVPSNLAIPAAAIISGNPGTTETAVAKVVAQNGNVVLASTNGLLVVDGGNGSTILANGRANTSSNCTLNPQNSVSMSNWGTPSEIPDYASLGTNSLFDFDRFIAVADATPNSYNTNSHNNHFKNIATFANAMRIATNHTLEGIVVVDINFTDRNWQNAGSAFNFFSNGINISGTLFYNFGPGFTTTSKFVVDAALNINPANLSGLVATNPATYSSGYPPIYADPSKNPTNINIAPGYQNFTANDDLPALIYSIGEVDLHGPVNICGLSYTPSYMEIENKAKGQTQYFKGSLIMGSGIYLENISSNSVSIFSYDPRPAAIELAACGNHNLALCANGTLFSWGDQSLRPIVTNVTGIASGVWHYLALVGGSPPISNVRVTNVQQTADGFAVSVPTSSGRVYWLEYKNLLTDSLWTALPLVAGNGSMQTLVDTDSLNPQRFYRVRQW